jgi:hypothetical protein
MATCTEGLMTLVVSESNLTNIFDPPSVLSIVRTSVFVKHTHILRLEAKLSSPPIHSLMPYSPCGRNSTGCSWKILSSLQNIWCNSNNLRGKNLTGRTCTPLIVIREIGPADRSLKARKKHNKHDTQTKSLALGCQNLSPLIDGHHLLCRSHEWMPPFIALHKLKLSKCRQLGS